MEYKFTLRGEVPAKKNSRQTLRSGKTIPSENYRKWHGNALFQLIFQRNSQKITAISEETSIFITLFHGDLRRRDGDNAASSVLDTLRDAGIIEDDAWQIVRKITVENLYRKGEPGCEIRIIGYRQK